MPSKNMLPKGQRRHSVKAEYRATRGVEPVAPAEIPTVALERFSPAPHSAASRPATSPGVPGETTLTQNQNQNQIQNQGQTQTLIVPAEALGLRLDQYLAQAIPELSRSRVQMLIDQGKVTVAGALARSRHKVTPGESVVLAGRPEPPPLAAEPEAIPLRVVFEDEFLAVIDKPAGMMVHAGAASPGSADSELEAESEVAAAGNGKAAATEPEATTAEPHATPSAAGTEGGDYAAHAAARHDPRSRGTLVNALLHHFGQGALSQTGGDLRPGIVHRLDKQTSGLIVVAKDDLTHRQLGDLFSARAVHKTYIALVHGHPARTDTTVSLPIGRDLVRRTRMTTRRPAGAPGVRSAVSHVHVVERLTTAFGPFTRVAVTIETGRTHQIRVHLQSLGYPVVGDTLYGAPRILQATAAAASASGAAPRRSRKSAAPHPSPHAVPGLSLPRNFLHAAELRFTHPRTGRELALTAPLPEDLVGFLAELTAPAAAVQ